MGGRRLSCSVGGTHAGVETLCVVCLGALALPLLARNILEGCWVRGASFFRAVRYVGKHDNSSATLCIESKLACATHQGRNADSTYPTGIIRVSRLCCLSSLRSSRRTSSAGGWHALRYEVRGEDGAAWFTHGPPSGVDHARCQRSGCAIGETRITPDATAGSPVLNQQPSRGSISGAGTAGQAGSGTRHPGVGPDQLFDRPQLQPVTIGIG
jgi:hypothetical protein